MISRRSFLQACLAGCLGWCTLSSGGCLNFQPEPHRSQTNQTTQADQINLKTGFAELHCGPDTWYWQRGNDFYLPEDQYLTQRSTLPYSRETLNLDTAVIGSGVAGLVCANRLIELGVDNIAIFEGSSKIGGCTQSLYLHSGNSNIGPQYVPWTSSKLSLPDNRDEIFLEFLQKQNIVTGTDASGRPLFNTDYLAFYPQERLLSLGRWVFGNYDKNDLKHNSADDQEHSAARFDEFLNEMSRKRGNDGLLYFTSPLNLVSSEAQSLDNVTLKNYLSEKKLWLLATEPFINRVVYSASGLTADKISAWVGLYHLCRDRYQMMQPTRTFLTWEKGCAQLLEPLIKQLTPLVKLNFPIISLQKQRNGIEIIGLDLRQQQKQRIIARQAVFAGSSTALYKLLNRPLLEKTTCWSSIAVAADLEPVIYNRKIFDAPAALLNRLLNYPEVIYWNSQCQREDSLPHSSSVLLRQQPQKISPYRLADYFKNIKDETLPFIDKFAQQSHIFWASNFGQFRCACPKQIWADSKLKSAAIQLKKQLPPLHLALTDNNTAPNFVQSFHNGYQTALEVRSALN
ncbi:MAG: NAD(P)-binding protein [Candidatus Bruticola sp.]